MANSVESMQGLNLISDFHLNNGTCTFDGRGGDVEPYGTQEPIRVFPETLGAATVPALDMEFLQPLGYGLDPMAELEMLQPAGPRCIPIERPLLKRGFLDTELAPELDKPCYAILGVKKSQFSIPLNRVPTWATYSQDQRFMIPQFTTEDVSMYYAYDSTINKKISLCFDDITCLEVDAIVNSSICGLIGDEKEGQNAYALRLCTQNFKVPNVGHIEITPGFGLPSKFVIHTTGESIGNLHMSCWSALDILCQKNLKSIAFPCTANGGKAAAQIVLQTVRKFLQLHADKIDRVIFCVNHDKTIEIYRRWMQIYFPLP